MKIIKVVAAIIIDGGKVFAARRGYGEFKGYWEFPGGKVKKGEKPDKALVREIWEELDTEIKVEEWFDTIEYDYPTFHLSMDCFLCRVMEGDLILKEHTDAKWLSAEMLNSVEWLPADMDLVTKIRNYLKQNGV
ncbi:MAG: (deoxy)nucleoside triphosphate pyrophosphohydrolase [Lachnospiraceae bacterium]|nr:(deoxy)nucleoside triphosphate pyrophosphohydrolase [Lachnospiraceae bacterium]